MSVLRVGSTGPEVGDLQQHLVEAGQGIAQDELAAELYGVTTEAAVRAFQVGRGLTVDGIAGPLTVAALAAPGDSRYRAPGWRCDIPAARLAVRGVLIEAVSDIGRREDPDGSNDGPDLAKFRTGGASWCALAVSTWYRAAAGGSPWGRLSAVWDIRDWHAHMARILQPGAPLEPGDLALMLRADRRGHTALVASVLEDGRICTVAGNESNAVRARIRQRGDFTAYARPLPL